MGIRIQILLKNGRPPLECVELRESSEDFMIITGDNGVGKSILLQELSKNNGLNLIFDHDTAVLTNTYYISSNRDYLKNISNNSLKPNTNNAIYKSYDGLLHEFEFNQYIFNLIINNNQDNLSEIKEIFEVLLAPKRIHFTKDNIDNDNRRIYFSLNEHDDNFLSIDKLSTGEIEVLNLAIELYKNIRENTLILIDEPETHLNPLRIKTFLDFLINFSRKRQCFLIVVTHSVEIISSISSEHLYRMINYDNIHNNQLIKINNNKQLLDTFQNLSGHRTFIPFNKKIIFCEGNENSIDKIIYEMFLTILSMSNVIIVPADSKNVINGLNDRILQLLSSNFSYNFYYTISDRDYDRREDNTASFKLKRYHIENYLLEEQYIYKALNNYFDLYFDINDLENLIKELIKQNENVFIIKKIYNYLITEKPKLNCPKINNKSSLDAIIKSFSDNIKEYEILSTEFCKLEIEQKIREFSYKLLKNWKIEIPGREILKRLPNFLRDINKIKPKKNTRFPSYENIRDSIIDQMKVDNYIPDDIQIIFNKINKGN